MSEFNGRYTVLQVLFSLPVWCAHKRKVPIDPATASALHWQQRKQFWTYKQAVADCRRLRLDGAGLFTGDGVGAFDLDHCVNPCGLAPRARQLIEQLRTYAELSPSGSGLHLLFRYDGGLPQEFQAKHVRPVEWGEGAKGNIELYRGRTFLTYTAKSLNDPPLPLRLFSQWEIDELIAEFFPEPKANAPSQPKFPPQPVSTSARDLSDRELLERAHGEDRDFWKYWNGEPGSLSDGSRSGIRFALLLKVAFSCGEDASRARRIAEDSPFFRSLDKHGRADWSRLFAREYHKALRQNPTRFGDDVRFQRRSHGSHQGRV